MIYSWIIFLSTTCREKHFCPRISLIITNWKTTYVLLCNSTRAIKNALKFLYRPWSAVGSAIGEGQPKISGVWTRRVGGVSEIFCPSHYRVHTGLHSRIFGTFSKKVRRENLWSFWGCVHWVDQIYKIFTFCFSALLVSKYSTRAACPKIKSEADWWGVVVFPGNSAACPVKLWIVSLGAEHPN